MLTFIMFNVIKLSFVMLSGIILIASLLNDIMLRVNMLLSFAMLSATSSKLQGHTRTHHNE